MSTNINFNKKLGLKGGTVITLPTSSTPSFSNVNSFLFDGVDEKMFSTANYTEINGAQNFSVSFWLKPIDSNDGLVFRFGTQGSTNRLACIYYPSLEIVIISFGTSSYYYRSVNGSIPLNQWSHIVYTYNGTQSRYNRPEIYVNGVLSQGINTGITSSQSNFDGTLELGGTGTSGQQNFGNNYIDEFAVWNNTTLTQTQANELYNSGTPSDLNNIASGLAQPTTWFRMGEEATWNGATWTMTDVNGGTTLRSINMVEANRTTDVPPNPFSNLNSFSFDGIDDYFVGVGGYTELSSGNAMSVSVWFKSSNYTSLGRLLFVGKHVEIYQNTSLYSNTRGCFYYRLRGNFGNSFATLGGATNLGVDNLVDGQWHHLCFTWDGATTTAKVYEDGVLKVTNTSASGTLNSSTTESYSIGAENNGNNPIDGLIDEAAVWTTALSFADVTAIYNNGVPNNLNDLSTPPTTWQRMGDLATWNGATWTMTDVNGGYTNRSINMVEANRTTDVPFNYKSILLDGVDDYVDCGLGLGNSQGTITNFSVSMWIKPSVTSGNDLFFNIGNFSNSFGEIAFQLLSNNLFIKIDNSAYRVWMPYTNTSAWEHLAFVYDGSNSANTKMYINGVLQSPSTGGVYPSSLNLSGLKTIIGAGYSVSYPYSGLQDEVSYFNTTLSQSDITSIYNDGVPNDISSLSPLSWWRCGDGDTAPTLTDNGSASNDGTMTNFTTFSTDVPT